MKKKSIKDKIISSEFFNFPLFLISLAFGILFVYLAQPDTKIIYVYPTPDNVDLLEYKDAANNCFEYSAENVECPKDKSLISTIPMQSSIDKN